MENLFISYTETTDFILAILIGRLSIADSMMLKSMLPKESKEQLDVIADLTDVSEVELFGMKALLMTNRQKKESGKKFILRIENEHPIQELLQLAKFEDQLVYSN